MNSSRTNPQPPFPFRLWHLIAATTTFAVVAAGVFQFGADAYFWLVLGPSIASVLYSVARREWPFAFASFGIAVMWTLIARL
ncbi:MAG: hypothetical protein ACKVP0_03550 [Pirellulaceae bacterium]